MVKRFMIGFVLGVGLVYWYIHSSGNLVGDMGGWMERSASRYRGDARHEAVEHETGQRRR